MEAAMSGDLIGAMAPCSADATLQRPFTLVSSSMLAKKDGTTPGTPVLSTEYDMHPQTDLTTGQVFVRMPNDNVVQVRGLQVGAGSPVIHVYGVYEEYGDRGDDYKPAPNRFGKGYTVDKLCTLTLTNSASALAETHPWFQQLGLATGTSLVHSTIADPATTIAAFGGVTVFGTTPMTAQFDYTGACGLLFMGADDSVTWNLAIRTL